MFPLATEIYIAACTLMLGIRRGLSMASLIVEANCPEHGIERYKIRIIKKYNIKPEKIMPKYRTRPHHELSGVVIGKNITFETARDYVLRYLNESAQQNTVMTIRLQR
jgi:hypothetical protein